MEDAQSHGYHPPAGNAGNPKEPELSPEAFAVMHGEVVRSGGMAVPEGGCLGEARRRLAMRDDSVEALVSRLGGEASKLAEKDSRVQGVFAAWSRCMANAGHQYRDPWQANDDRRWRGSAVATDAEIAVAVADVGCKQESKLVEIWATIEAAYQQRLIEEHAAELAEAKAALDAEARMVAEVLASVR